MHEVGVDPLRYGQRRIVTSRRKANSSTISSYVGPSGRKTDSCRGLRAILAELREDPTQVERRRTILVADDLRTPEEFIAAMPQFHLNPESFPPCSEMPRELSLGPLVPHPASHAESGCLGHRGPDRFPRGPLREVGAGHALELDEGTQEASMLQGFMGALRGAAESSGLNVQTEIVNVMSHRPMDLNQQAKSRPHSTNRTGPHLP
jgi:hypothetical protein